MDEVTGRRHRDRVRALGGVRADRLPRRHRRPVLPPVRTDDRGRDDPVGLQLAHAEPRDVRAPSPAARRGEGLARTSVGSAPRAASSVPSTALSTARSEPLRTWRPVHRSSTGRRARRLRRAPRPDGRRVPDDPDGLHPGAGQGLPDRRDPASRRRVARAYGRGRAARERRHPRHAGRQLRRGVRGLLGRDARQQLRTPAPSSSARSRSRSAATDRRRTSCSRRCSDGYPRSRGQHLRDPAAAGARPRHVGRLQAARAGPRRTRLPCAPGGDGRVRRRGACGSGGLRASSRRSARPRRSSTPTSTA